MSMAYRNFFENMSMTHFERSQYPLFLLFSVSPFQQAKPSLMVSISDDTEIFLQKFPTIRY
jgi:hypothetical protein